MIIINASPRKDCNTLQVDDYSKYRMRIFNEESKKSHHDTQFPMDMQEAFNMGCELA